VRAFAREIETTAARVPGREVTSIFLGGGTPSLMQPQTVGAVLDAIGKHWHVARDVEVTLEANPTSVEATRFRGYRAAGVNRVSLGGVISANTGLDPANASSGILTQAIEILQDPNTTFRFDASDLMPSAVGAGTFWKGMVSWISGTPVDEVTAQIEAGWPAS